ncbi:MAG: peptide-methionine (S)-S-oxide reductase MsrA [Deltaproteobacteria bacterium]|nr:peptide-methionine (S)-S-oxide reductase MsrA [Deltaproteobacteria bacterium]
MTLARLGALLLLASLLPACAGQSTASAEETTQPRTQPKGITGPSGLVASSTQGTHEVALLAGGCFWCLETAYDEQPGIIEAISGYAGGALEHPTYKQVGYDDTGHTEVVRVVYDPKKVTYEQILTTFWHNIDPFDGRGQFCDKGDQYRSAIFPMDDAQQAIAEKSKAKYEKQLGKSFATKIEPPATFWRAEDYHQDFYKTNPVRYGSYRLGCGRDRRLKEIWGDDAGH